jgi:uncharacterized protein with von Willebrand factor type A (vWA) domain
MNDFLPPVDLDDMIHDLCYSPDVMVTEDDNQALDEYLKNTTTR